VLIDEVLLLLFLSFCGEELHKIFSDNPQLLSFLHRRFESETGFIIRTNRPDDPFYDAFLMPCKNTIKE
jgi:hypothetical protein